MSARDELIEIVTRAPQSARGDRVWATDLVDEVLREAVAKQRAHHAAQGIPCAGPGCPAVEVMDLIDPDKVEDGVR